MGGVSPHGISHEFEYGRGIAGAADVGDVMSGNLNSVEPLARILYNYYDRNGDSKNALIFNNLVAAWGDIKMEMAHAQQRTLFS